MDQPIRILVVEHCSLFRRGLIASLEAEPGFSIVGQADTTEEACALSKQTIPDIALVSTTVSDVHGVWLASELRRQFPSMITIVIAEHEDDDELFGAIRAGASAYCDRNVEEATLHELIRRSARGEHVINEQLLSKPYIASRVLDQFRDTHQRDIRLAGTFMPLTDRELEILRKVSDGMTNAEIGFALGISAQTVKNHVTSILRKLAVNDRTQAVVMALRHGWLSIDGADEPPSSGTAAIPHRPER
jgi:DNA-binding NarL/FixJ family response regulator